MERLAVVGHTARDLVDGEEPRAGGVPLYAARALRALEEPGLVVTRCAEGDRPLLGSLYALGLPVVWRAEETTPVFRITNLAGERQLEIEALGTPWSPDDVRTWLGPELAGVEWVHAGPLWAGDFPEETLAELGRGRRLSFDAQGLVRPGRVGPVTMDGRLDRSLLAHVDVLHISKAELDVLGLSLDERSLRTLGVPEVIVTLGAGGSVVFADDLAEHVPTRRLEVADPTGAGDGFVAAYLASRRSGHAPVSAARRATQLLYGLLSGRIGAA